MNRPRLFVRIALAVGLSVLGAAKASAVRRTEDPLALVPADAATVGVIHWNALRASPIGARVFADMDRISTDGDAARFLDETGLTPSQDIDTMVFAAGQGSKAGQSDAAVVLFEGRFDLARIRGALTARGATLQKTANGDYYRLSDTSGEPGAVALVNRNLIVCGNEGSVTAALARKENGGAGGLTSGNGLGRYLGRIDQDASAWALVDLTRFPATQNREAHVDIEVHSDSEPGRAIVGVMKSVSVVALQATVHGDAADLSAAGLTSDAETRRLLGDSLRGLLAMWRLGVQDKSPELVPVLRGFQVEDDGEAVSIRGSLPGSYLRSLTATEKAGK